MYFLLLFLSLSPCLSLSVSRFLSRSLDYAVALFLSLSLIYFLFFSSPPPAPCTLIVCCPVLTYKRLLFPKQKDTNQYVIFYLVRLKISLFYDSVQSLACVHCCFVCFGLSITDVTIRWLLTPLLSIACARFLSLHTALLSLPHVRITIMTAPLELDTIKSPSLGDRTAEQVEIDLGRLCGRESPWALRKVFLWMRDTHTCQKK